MRTTSEITVTPLLAVGDDAEIVRRALAGTGNPERDIGRTLDWLVRNRHWSPLEFGWASFELRLPLWLVPQMLRHRVASFQQSSLRYREVGDGEKDLPPEFWMPAGMARLQHEAAWKAHCSRALTAYW